MKRLMILTLVSMVLEAGSAFAQSPAAHVWDKTTVNAFARLPIQEGGRIKPLDTYASVELLTFNGKRSCKLPNGAYISPTEWLLDCFFFPGDAKQYKMFLIENADVLSMLSLPSTQERDRYSYNDLAPAREKLSALASQFSGIDEKQRTPAQGQLINLAHNLFDYESIVGMLDFARVALPVAANPKLAAIFGNASQVRFSDVVARAPQFKEEYMRLNGTAATNASDKADFDAMSKFLHDVDVSVGDSSGLTILPPSIGMPDKEWLSPARLLEEAFVAPQVDSVHIEALRAFERMAASADAGAIKQDAVVLSDAIVRAATARGEYDKVPLELAFYKLNLFWYSLYLYAFSFVLVAVSWVRPKSRIVNGVALASVVLPTILLSTGIALRCIIRSRPPVTTLYETVLFITAVAVIVALFIEITNRQRVGVSLGAILGTVGIFLANKYELIERGDTMPSMVAVLDTNFWLSTHVTTVTMGYAAGLLAAAIAHVYIIGAALGIRKNDPAFYRSVAKMTYGVLCFGLLFSTVGTVLGGIWANNSWGRFWGWDPKENGALMIVLWQIIVLHARLAGYIKDFGTVMAAIAGGIIVAFSWFGVNLLGVGLHTYGFTSGIATALSIFYTIEVAVLFIGAVVFFVRPVSAPAEQPSKRKKLGPASAHVK